MQLADRGLNSQALAIEEAQTEIRLIIKNGYLNGLSQQQLDDKVQRAIRKVLRRLGTPVLREAAYRSLNAFATRQYRTWVRSFGLNVTFLAALLAVSGTKTPPQARSRAEQTLRAYEVVRLETDAKGIPLQTYAREYIRERVVPVMERMAAEVALDPDDISGKNSMRNRAEMEVRYAAHLSEIEGLRAAGVRLVVASVHADCSDRCYPFQGRLYSLDRTYGVTDDGRPFEPIENATDIYYTTRAGKVYKNGLMGFNCRHKLLPYVSGMVIPVVSAETQRREQAINTRQRRLETVVRQWKARELMYRDVDPEKHTEAWNKARVWRREYIRFSHANGRAYYPDRIKLL